MLTESPSNFQSYPSMDVFLKISRVVKSNIFHLHFIKLKNRIARFRSNEFDQFDFFIFKLEQIIVLNTSYNKPIPKISHVKTLQNLCKMRYKKTIRK